MPWCRRGCERLSLNSPFSEAARWRGVIGLSVPQSNEAQGGRAPTGGVDGLPSREEDGRCAL